MVSHQGRLYVLALGVLVFFLTWTVVAAHPWATASPDPRLRALAIRETQLRHEARLVRKVVAARWAAYRVQLKLRRTEIAKVATSPVAAPATATASAVQVVNLPAHVITRTS